MIDWVENGKHLYTLNTCATASHADRRNRAGNASQGLNATVLSGANEGQTHQLCEWPLRPYWSGNSTTDFECVYDQASLDTWFYEFDSFPFPIY
jgi:hypothetical protein